MRSRLLSTILWLVLLLTSGSYCKDVDSINPITPSLLTKVVAITTPTEILQDATKESTRTLPAATYTPVLTETPSPLVSKSTEESKVRIVDESNEALNPLTGEIPDYPANLLRRPLAIKISNAPARYTRPQSGIGMADIVFEHVTESAITRFTAIFYGHTPVKVGPIRSARLIDLQIVPMYDAALVYSGSSIGVSRRLFSPEFPAPIIRPHEEGYYRSGENKPYEHTLYAIPASLWSSLDTKGENQSPELYSTMVFSDQAPSGGSPTTGATVRYRDWAEVTWRFNHETGQYLRWTDGERHNDANSGDQVSAANVVLLLTPHTFETTICEYQVGDRCLAYSIDIQMMGSGDAILLRDGLMYDLTWRRNSSQEMISLEIDVGVEAPLQIGNTWYQVIPDDYPDSITIE